MPRYVALLRAINVGGHTVPMARLKQLFEAQGFSNIATVIASGNVLFDCRARRSAPLESRIGQHLEHALGYEVIVFIRTPEELAGVSAHAPFPAAELDAPGAALHVMFLPSPLSPAAKAAVIALGTPRDVFHVHGREIYWLCRGRFSDTLVNPRALATAIGMPTTARKATTVQKLAALARTAGGTTSRSG